MAMSAIETSKSRDKKWTLTLINKASRFSLKAKKLNEWCCPLFVRGTRFPKQSANIGFPSRTYIKKKHLNELAAIVTHLAAFPTLCPSLPPHLGCGPPL